MPVDAGVEKCEQTEQIYRRCAQNGPFELSASKIGLTSRKISSLLFPATLKLNLVLLTWNKMRKKSRKITKGWEILFFPGSKKMPSTRMFWDYRNSFQDQFVSLGETLTCSILYIFCLSEEIRGSGVYCLISISVLEFDAELRSAFSCAEIDCTQMRRITRFIRT